MRSFFPKFQSFCDDMDEREADIAFLSEVWEKKENKKHRKKLETMFEMRGIEYISTPRPYYIKADPKSNRADLKS